MMVAAIQDIGEDTPIPISSLQLLRPGWLAVRFVPRIASAKANVRHPGPGKI